MARRRVNSIFLMTVAGIIFLMISLFFGCENQILTAVKSDNKYLSLPSFLLTVRSSDEANGTVTPTGDTECKDGFLTDITASAVSPYQFRGWIQVDGNGTAEIGNASESTTNVNVTNGDVVIQANFSLVTPVLVTDSGSIVNPGEELYLGSVSLSGSEQKVLTLTGDLYAGVEVSSVSMVGGHIGDFSLSPSRALPAQLAHEETMTITVTYDATDIGYRNSTLRIATDDAGNPEIDIVLSGSGGVWNSLTTKTDNFYTTGDYYGSAVDVCETDISGTIYEFVAASQIYHDNGAELNVGYANIFNVSDSWASEIASSISLLNENAMAGFSISILGNFDGAAIGEPPIIAVGVPYNPGGVYPYGSVQVGEKDGSSWTWINGTNRQRLVPSAPEADEQFGLAMDMSDNFIAVGANRRDISLQTDAGAVFVYNRSGTSAYFGTPNGVEKRNQNRIITAPAPTANANFGSAVASDEDWILAGAPSINSQRGAAYIFTGSTGTHHTTFYDPEPQNVDFFGSALAISGNYCVIGAYGDDIAYSGGGSVIVYKYDGSNWNMLTRLVPDAAGASFGWSVDISDKYVVVGARNEGSDGAVYIYEIRGDDIVFLKKMPGSSGERNGHDVAIAGDLIVSGAPSYDTPSSNIGRIHIYRSE